jgi:invasion protein IalB
MPSICVTIRSITASAVVIAALASPLRAQDVNPGTETQAVSETGRQKPKAKPKPSHTKMTPAATSVRAPTAASASPALWPAGATSVSESYGDWTMTCVRPADKTACVVAQSQGDTRTGRRKFGIELKAPQDGEAQGVVVMPFGLAIEPGITFKLDDQVLGQGAPYSSCTGEGCLVSIRLPTLATDAMRSAKVLTVTGRKTTGAAGIEAGEPASMTVPLVGFSQAFDRAMALSG